MFTQTRILLLFAIWFFQFSLSASGLSPNHRPNIVLVMTDDQGYGEFSCHGNPIAKTPHIDELAATSIRLTDFHVAPMCTPTRGELMTGLDAFRNGAINVSSGRTLLRPELETMANVFQNAGYCTGLFGKWHLGDNYPFRPEDRGFDEAIWFPSSHINSAADYWDNDYFDDVYIHNQNREKFQGYCTDVFFQQAMEWIERCQENDRPFFVYLPLNAAHWPWFVPEKYREQVRMNIREHPESVQNVRPEKLESLISFLAMGANIDENMGRLEQFLVASDLCENTIFVFLTDNGSTMGPEYYNAGMRGGKITLWEGGHRVPCFIRWAKGRLGPPREVDILSQVQDLLPTLADLAGIGEVPNQWDGESLAPTFRGEEDTLEDRILVINYSRMPGTPVSYTTENPAIPQRDGAAVLWKKWRLLENRELYDVQADPHQDHDVAAQNPEEVAKMSSHLQSWWDKVQPGLLKPQRVIIGSEAENPLMLSACEWLDVFVDQQAQVRRGERKNGIWHLIVDQPGRYTFELRRWPRESDLPLQASLPATQVSDGVYPPGKSLPIHSAKIRIGEQEATLLPNDREKSFTYATELMAGPIELQTWLLDDEKEAICGAFYVYVKRDNSQ